MLACNPLQPASPPTLPYNSQEQWSPADRLSGVSMPNKGATIPRQNPRVTGLIDKPPVTLMEISPEQQPLPRQHREATLRSSCAIPLSLAFALGPRFKASVPEDSHEIFNLRSFPSIILLKMELLFHFSSSLFPPYLQDEGRDQSQASRLGLHKYFTQTTGKSGNDAALRHNTSFPGWMSSPAF